MAWSPAEWTGCGTGHGVPYPGEETKEFGASVFTCHASEIFSPWRKKEEHDSAWGMCGNKLCWGRPKVCLIWWQVFGSGQQWLNAYYEGPCVHATSTVFPASNHSQTGGYLNQKFCSTLNHRQWIAYPVSSWGHIQSWHSIVKMHTLYKTTLFHRIWPNYQLWAPQCALEKTVNGCFLLKVSMLLMITCFLTILNPSLYFQVFCFPGWSILGHSAVPCAETALYLYAF